MRDYIFIERFHKKKWIRQQTTDVWRKVLQGYMFEHRSKLIIMVQHYALKPKASIHPTPDRLLKIFNILLALWPCSRVVLHTNRPYWPLCVGSFTERSIWSGFIQYHVATRPKSSLNEYYHRVLGGKLRKNGPKVWQRGWKKLFP